MTKSHLIRVDFASSQIRDLKFRKTQIIDCRLPVKYIDPRELTDCYVDEQSSFLEVEI